ncbi:MAG TPA: sugar ABC transporter ATP-binding protein [Pseudonocardiaceae bacterium]|jgi:ribose transport system ATP-binding protein|nr:sugar ABC transporter ATP-binding protein [Pseudonocardiaceae bacterium]
MSATVPVPDALLDVAGVGKSFPGVHALREASLALRPGRVHALVGENGAGKSTLIKVITGVYRPDRGRIRLAGEDVSFATPVEAQRAGISTIYQEVNLVPLMSVARNLFLGREPRRFARLVDVRRMNTLAAEILRDYGVDIGVSGVARPLGSLGLGAQQMVAIARAIQLDARVVIMDEPTSSLERREVLTLFGVIRRLRSAGIAVLYVSHRLDELYTICDDVTVLRDGAVVHTGELAELDRLRLVSLMLGRDVSLLRRQGVTAFGEHDNTQDTEPVLVAEDLTVRPKLHGVSLAIRPGEVLGLGGLLGSGRSETAKAIAGGLRRDSGTVTVSGKRLRRGTSAEAVRAGVVMLPEDRKAEGLIPSLSVRQNIVLAALPRLSRFGLASTGKQNEIVDYFMDRLRIKAASPDQKVAELSGGNQQKVLLARWLCLHPKVLLLDEPTRGIDVGAKAEVQKLIDEFAQEGLGVLLISSELEELIEGSDRVLVLRDGAPVTELAGAQVSEPELLHALASEPLPEDAAAAAGRQAAGERTAGERAAGQQSTGRHAAVEPATEEAVAAKDFLRAEDFRTEGVRTEGVRTEDSSSEGLSSDGSRTEGGERDQ